VSRVRPLRLRSRSCTDSGADGIYRDLPHYTTNRNRCRLTDEQRRDERILLMLLLLVDDTRDRLWGLCGLRAGRDPACRRFHADGFGVYTRSEVAP
jgi:hypothetical protein